MVLISQFGKGKLLTAENIDYVVDVPEPEKPKDDATAEENKDYMVEYEAWAKDNKRAHIFLWSEFIRSVKNSNMQIEPGVLGNKNQ